MFLIPVVFFQPMQYTVCKNSFLEKQMKKSLIAFMLLGSSQAFAYGDHSDWSLRRGSPYQGSYQFITETEVLRTIMRSEDNIEKTTFKGMGLKTGIGVELVEFVRFSTYHLYRDTSANPNTSLRGSEVGGDIKTSFYGPVVNVEFGLGLNASSLTDQRSTESIRYFGKGYTGSIGFERFVGQRASIVFTLKGQREDLRPEITSIEKAPILNTTGACLSLLLWLN
jgi:hypothetical protein